MFGRGSLGQAVRLLGAATVVPLGCAPAFAQAVQAPAGVQHPQPVQSSTQQQSPPDAAELDPSAPIAPMPDLGVDWPDLNAKETKLPTSGVPTSTQQTVSQLKYTWAIEGLGNLGNSGDLLKAFRLQSALEADRKNSANAAQIGRRSRADSELLVQLLRSQGYYDAIVEPRTERSGDALSVILTAEPGQQYRFASVELPGLEAAGEVAAKLRNAFAVKAGDPVIAEDVTSAGLMLTTALGQEGFAEAKLGEQDIEVNHQTRLATLVQPVTPGPVARFGAIRVGGKPPFSAHHLAIIARFKRGDIFKRSKLEDLRRALIATSLVAVADIRVVPVNGGRIVDIDVHLEPAPSHTIAGQLGYGTGQGISAEVDWTDRNMFNPEGAITLRGIAGTQEQLAAVQYRRNNFLQRDQVLNLAASVGHQKYAAYKANTIELSGDIERQSNFIWQKTWTWTYGVDLLGTDELGVFNPAGIKSTRKFAIAALPLSLGYDGSDNLLDPTRGFRLSGRISPEVSFHGGSFTYARTQIDASAYHPIGETIVVAGRIRFGTIIGASLFDIAPSRRFYSGGGGSVRGYGYQQLGPRDVDGDPIGGRGLAEFGLETRIRLKQFGGNFGIVPFFDGGTLSTKAMPDFSNWRYAVGLGARYYSSFGPIRIDFGIPLNRRQGDGPIAVTVSLGQAF